MLDPTSSNNSPLERLNGAMLAVYHGLNQITTDATLREAIPEGRDLDNPKVLVYHRALDRLQVAIDEARFCIGP